jgi:ABC-type dipeptide/oligopeptide/nickel transport system permease component
MIKYILKHLLLSVPLVLGIVTATFFIARPELPMTPLYPARWTHVVHRRVQGLSSLYRTDPLWYAEELWLEEEK